MNKYTLISVTPLMVYCVFVEHEIETYFCIKSSPKNQNAIAIYWKREIYEICFFPKSFYSENYD